MASKPNNLLESFIKQIPVVLIFIAGLMIICNTGNIFIAHLSVIAVINAIVILGIVMLTGVAGQVSVGQAAFFGLGAYVYAIMTVRLEAPFLVAFFSAALFTMLIAYCMGIPALQLRGYYLSLSTLAFGELVFILLRELRFLTGGTAGIRNIPYVCLMGQELKSPQLFFPLAWTCLILSIAFCRNLLSSRHGRALKVVQFDELLAGTVGVNVSWYKVNMFALSGFLAGMAGALYAGYMRFIVPGLFGLEASIMMLVMAFLGGVGNVWGSLVGAIIMVVVTVVLAPYQDWNTIIYGAVLLCLVVYFPKGIMGLCHLLYKMASEKYYKWKASAYLRGGGENGIINSRKFN